jgi:site-specific recombinase XerD
MAITYKLFLDERTPKGNDKFALKLRITYDRKHKVVPVNVELKMDEWDPYTQKVKSKHPNAKLITVKINQLINEIQERALKFETVEKVYTVHDLCDSDQQGTGSVTFTSFVEREIADLIAVGRVGNANAYKEASNRLVRFAGKQNLKFENIDYKFLEKFAQAMLTDEVKINSVALYMREIRAIYNRAIRADVVEAKYYPFGKYKIKTTKTISRALSVQEMQKIAATEIEVNSPMWHSRNYFLLSFCLIGINFTDLFKLTPGSIQNNRIIFSRSKTKKIYSVYIHPVAADIISHYFKHTVTAEYLFPVLHKDDCPVIAKKKLKQVIKTTNEYLGRIAKNLEINQPITT